MTDLKTQIMTAKIAHFTQQMGQHPSTFTSREQVHALYQAQGNPCGRNGWVELADIWQEACGTPDWLMVTHLEPIHSHSLDAVFGHRTLDRLATFSDGSTLRLCYNGRGEAFNIGTTIYHHHGTVEQHQALERWKDDQDWAEFLETRPELS